MSPASEFIRQGRQAVDDKLRPIKLRRLQIKLSEADFARLEKMRVHTGARSLVDVIRKAINAYEDKLTAEP